MEKSSEQAHSLAKILKIQGDFFPESHIQDENIDTNKAIKKKPDFFIQTTILPNYYLITNNTIQNSQVEHLFSMISLKTTSQMFG